MILAHGIGGRTDLPVPLGLVITAAVVVLVVSFGALAVMWPSPRLQGGPPEPRGRGVTAPVRPVLSVLGVVGLIMVVGQVVVPMTGATNDVTRPSVAPVLVWVIFWLVVPFAGALVGNLYTDLNPWRAIARWSELGPNERPEIQHRLGVWPATIVFGAFVWLELIYWDSGDPVALGVAAIVYTMFLVIVMAVVGRETGLAVFDAFTPYNRLISAISPLGRNEQGEIFWRGWMRSLPVVPEWPGLWVFVVAMIATVSFDGASGTQWFETITGGLGRTTTGATFLLIATVNLLALAYYGVAGFAARMAGEGWTASRVAQRFAHTLVPIALAYAVAHYFTLIIFEGQQLVAAISDPFGIGWNLFGTADWRVNFFITTSAPIWWTQVAFILGGHILGVVLAHDRSLHDFGQNAVKSQYAMLILMIALTSLGLLILSG